MIAIRFMPLLLFAVAPLSAKQAGLTIPTGESWLFRITDGSPSAARRVAAAATPAPGEVKLSARRMMGTMITVQNNSPTAYSFRATLIAADGKATAARSCVLPAGNRLAMESWPQIAVAVRVSDFKPTTAATCR